MRPGTYSFRLIVPVDQEGSNRKINIPVDAVVMPKAAKLGDFPLLLEAKSAEGIDWVWERRVDDLAGCGL